MVGNRGVATGGATGAAAPPILLKEEGNSDVIALMTLSLLKDGPTNMFLFPALDKCYIYKILF